MAAPKQFSTGSLGWYASGKIIVEVDGQQCQTQVGLSLVLVGSKEAPAEPAAPAPKAVVKTPVAKK